jgi:hypothetical protein
VVLALALVGVGCSNDDPGDADETTASPPASAAAPVLGAWHALVTDPERGVLLVNGHPEDASQPGPVELWRWDGEQWTAVEPEGEVPSARNFAAVAMDADRDLLVLHGGLTPEGASDETWTWDGTAWSLAASGSDGPGPRSSASMAYDAVAGRTLLYGGDDGTDQYNDTWAWDGEAWERVAETGPDPVRWPAFFAFDEVTGTVVMYGGHQVVDEDAPLDLGDTWMWDDDRWRAVPGADQPGSLVNANSVVHPTLGLLLVGGASARTGETGSAWAWTGASWEALSDDVVPPRQAFGLAYDVQREVVVLTGGVVEPGSTERHQDVWEWSGDPSTPAVRVPAGE